MNLQNSLLRLMLLAALSVAASQVQALGRPFSGAQYAQLLTFATEPGIAAATFDVEEELGDTTYDIYKFPLQHEFDVDGWNGKLILRGGLSYMRANQDQRWDPADSSEVIDTDWKSRGGNLGIGARIPLGKGFSFVPGLGFGIATLENNAEFEGRRTQSVIQPLTDGAVYNWDLDATIFSGLLGLSYSGDIGNGFDLVADLYYTHSYVSSFDVSSDFQDFGDSTDNITFKADIGHPLGISLAGYPLDGVLHFGNTTFVGPNRDVLGFSYFNEVGFSLRTNPSKLASQLKLPFTVSSLSLGVNVLFGDDLTGWSMLFGYKF
ncbi:MAG: hypothetical protein ABFR19_00365 [Pseudomonadota bacterium]